MGTINPSILKSSVDTLNHHAHDDLFSKLHAHLDAMKENLFNYTDAQTRLSQTPLSNDDDQADEEQQQHARMRDWNHANLANAIDHYEAEVKSARFVLKKLMDGEKVTILSDHYSQIANEKEAFLSLMSVEQLRTYVDLNEKIAGDARAEMGRRIELSMVSVESVVEGMMK